MGDKLIQKQHIAVCYRLLASCFYPPEKDLLLQEDVCDNLVTLLKGISVGAMEAAQRMDNALRESDGEALQVEYAALFVGPFEVPAPPYGSVYLEKGRRLMGDTTMEIAHLYRESGLDLVVKQPADHIALELEFMHYLVSREISCRNDGDQNAAGEFADLQQDFFGRFLCRWVEPFCQDIKSNTDNEFYLALADILSSFVNSEVGRVLEGDTVPQQREAVA